MPSEPRQDDLWADERSDEYHARFPNLIQQDEGPPLCRLCMKVTTSFGGGIAGCLDCHD